MQNKKVKSKNFAYIIIKEVQMIRINLQFFGGRGATSSVKGGSSSAKGETELPQRAEYAMNNANPNYLNPNAEAEGWHHNCQSCAVTFEALMRGEDTEAVPHKDGEPWYEADGKEHGWRDCFEGKQETIYTGYEDYVKAVKMRDFAKAGKALNKVGVINGIEGQTVAVNSKTAINRQMKKWGDGARATLEVTWKDGSGGHIINVINKGGKPIAIDAQSHQIKDLGKLLSGAKRNCTGLTRVDNLKFTSDIQYLTKGKQ